jgi:hypothetical protein
MGSGWEFFATIYSLTGLIYKITSFTGVIEPECNYCGMMQLCLLSE